MKESVDVTRLAQVVRLIEPQGTLLRSWPLAGGVSAQMLAFEIGLPGGQTKKMILRQPGTGAFNRNPNAAASEFKINQMIHAAGLATQVPYYLDQSGSLLSVPFLVVEYVEGNLDFVAANITDYCSQLAAQLGRIHSVERSKLDLALLHEQEKGFAERIADRLIRADESPDERRIRETLCAVSDFSQWNEPTLLHGDFWPGNILWKQGQIVAVIDWGDAEWGDPLADLAGARLDLLFMFGKAAMNDFTDRYQATTTIDFTNLPYWDLCSALHAAPHLAEWAAPYPLFGRQDITEKSMRENLQWFIAQAFEKLPPTE